MKKITVAYEGKEFTTYPFPLPLRKALRDAEAWPSCYTCFFLKDEGLDISPEEPFFCNAVNKTIPARVMAVGCNKHETNIPF